MKDLVKTLFGLGITVGLSDRETFVREASKVIEGFQDDPEKAKQWATALIAYLENKRNTMNLEDAMKSVVSEKTGPDNTEIEELTNAIKDLTKELQNRRDK